MMHPWCPLHRWLVSRGAELLTCVEAAAVSLQLLQRLAGLQAPVDETGSVLQPPPRVHRLLVQPRCLPHVCQVGRHPRPPGPAPCLQALK